RGDIYLSIDDTIKGLEDYNLAVNVDKTNEETYEKRAQLFYQLERIEDSNADFKKMIELNPANVLGYMGIGRNARDAEDYPQAIEHFTKAIQLEPEYSSGYSFRAECLLEQKKYVQAADDIIKALSIDYDNKAYYMMYLFPEEQLPLIIMKLQAQSVNDPHNGAWTYYTGQLYEQNHNYFEAIEAYNKALEIDNEPDILKDIADCYNKLGQPDKAAEAMDKALALDPDNIQYVMRKAIFVDAAGDHDKAISLWSDVIEQLPDFYYAYYCRGFIRKNTKQYDEALTDMEKSLLLQPDELSVLLTKADILTLKGETDKAMDTYRQITELDSIPTDESRAMYAWLALGEKDKAIDFMNQVIETDTLNEGNYYDAACLYARMGAFDTSIAYLHTAVEKGYNSFAHIMVDSDLDSLRQTPAFQEFYNQYQEQFEPRTVTKSIRGGNEGNVNNAETSEKIEIPFTPEQGCASVKCTINDLPLTFIFDTGASTVSLSQLEANFMLKNGYLKRDDFVGTGRFVDANGNISEDTIINLRNVEFGGLTLTNVKASVVRNQKAPLLLGQSVLGRLGSIQIDNTARKLIISR
ncbi:MAG: tetratricopeptide repeat protein, partial [Prevotellaceae bacterium]|nr:tetratricopeptide repeat protein [Prevotellaceae bacterium]